MDEVLKAAEVLGIKIHDSEICRRVSDLEQKVMADPEASAAFGDYVSAQQAIQDAISSGEADQIAEAGEKLETAQNRIDSMEMVLELRKAQQDFSQMMENVNRILQLIIRGETNECGNCGGNCSSCGGCGGC